MRPAVVVVLASESNACEGSQHRNVETVMIDLGNLEKRLNSDLKLRQEFLTDPVATFRREGIQLSPDQERRLREATVRARSTRPNVSGTSLGGTVAFVWFFPA